MAIFSQSEVPTPAGGVVSRRWRGIGRMRAIERAGVVVHHRVPDGDIVVPSPNPYVLRLQWVERHARLLAPLLDNLLQRVQGA